MRTREIRYLLPVLEQHKCRHCPYPRFLSDLFGGVDVHLVEGHPLEFFVCGEFLKDWRYSLAGAAPGGPEIKDRGLFGIDDVSELLNAGSWLASLAVNGYQ